MFLERIGNHPRCTINYDPSHFVLQQLDYLAFIDIYARAHQGVPRQGRGVQSDRDGRASIRGFQTWIDRAGRFRSLGDGQVDLRGDLLQAGDASAIDCWAVLEWECCLKNPEDGAREGAPFIRDHIIRVTDKAFDDFAGAETDQAQIRRMLGI